MSLPFLLPWPRVALLIRRLLTSQWDAESWPIAKTEFRSLGIPGAEILAPFVASTELVCAVLIAVGLATRPAAVMLCGVMTVAIVTAAAPEKHITASWRGLLEFFYLPEVLLFLLLAWVVFAGPGRASLDARLCARS